MCACAGTCIRVQKCFFRTARAHADIFFKTLYTIKLLEDRPVSVCKVKLQESQLTFGTRSSDGSKGLTPYIYDSKPILIFDK